ncbi:ABC transporter permease [Acuticoccus sp. M5D2P5]|uniref:ABC transporter permease n=1 Tax=Acuticoccus kalidii TaxID=2910977 RepID=UPI001F32AA09|nr:ABC transporter permease [Acuticoccus kalidii]MCF3932827.1 ABC transporter permease [Acuticoccus kalidii]
MDVRSPPEQPSITVTRDGDMATAVFSGAWTVGNAQYAEAAVTAVDCGKAMRVTLDLSGVTTADSSGAWLIHRERANAEFEGRRVELANVSPRLQFLLDEIENHIPEPLPHERRPYAAIRFLTNLGETTVTIGKDLVELLAILGVFGLRLATAATNPRHLRLTSILSNFDRTCRGAVPIVMLMSFLVGLIIAQQAGFYLQTFGAALYVVDLSGVLILREIGVLLAAILVAGRSGSAFTAEIGSMRMQEEVDALHTLGLDPVEVLVVPRLIALIIALPVLAFLSAIAAMCGSILITWLYLGITPDLYMQRLHEAVTPLELYVGISKAPFMALIIGLVACSEGLKVGGSSESLGRHTTSAVVKAIFLVIVVDGLFAMFFAAVGI